MPTRKPTPRRSARTSDKFVLYQLAVQSPEAEVDYCIRTYRKHYGEAPTKFREDFCGTHLISCEFVKRGRNNQSWGIDLDQPTLDWGIRHNSSRLRADQRARLHLVNQNVLHVTQPKVHVIGAFNFSYFIFKTHAELVRYFRAAHESLEKKGLFVVDAYGGWESQQVMQERRKIAGEGFTYVWDQAEYNPIDDHTLCHIHFEFPDGTRMRKAFSYDWRLWTLAGVSDAMIAAGFRTTEVYWEGSDAKGEGNGIYRRTLRAENGPGWTAYVVGVP